MPSQYHVAVHKNSGSQLRAYEQSLRFLQTLAESQEAYYKCDRLPLGRIGPKVSLGGGAFPTLFRDYYEGIPSRKLSQHWRVPFHIRSKFLCGKNISARCVAAQNAQVRGIRTSICHGGERRCVASKFDNTVTKLPSSVTSRRHREFTEQMSKAEVASTAVSSTTITLEQLPETADEMISLGKKDGEVMCLIA